MATTYSDATLIEERSKHFNQKFIELPSVDSVDDVVHTF